jgi:alpha-1,2-mannosyltransferase
MIRVIAVLAAGITLYQVSRPGFLFGITPDIAAWLGGSIRFVHGAMPYRDFDLLQPPGFTLLASPLAFVSEWIGTRDALAILRLCTPLLAAASVLLIGRVVRHHGPAAVIVACGVMAFYPAELYALRSGLLESVVVVFCLAGAALLFDGESMSPSRRRIFLGGISFGIAGTVKAPAIVPVLVLVVLCLPDIRHRFLPFLAGVVAGFGIPTLPFFLLAPGPFIRDVVITALSSIPAGHRVSVTVRLGDVTGISAFDGAAPAAIIATVVIAGIVIAAFLPRPRRPSTLEWFAIAATVLAVIAQLGPAYYFANYTAFVTPFLGLLMGISVARLVAQRSARTGVWISAVGVVVLFTHQVISIQGSTASDIAGVVDAVIPAGGCTLSDAPSKLVSTNRFVATSSNCNTMIDPEGATLSYGYGSVGAVDLWTVMVERSDYMVTSTPFANWYIPPGARLRAYVTANFRLLRSGGLLFYVRNGFPSGNGQG